MRIVIKKHIEIYTLPNGRQPFIEWLESLDHELRYRVKVRLDRIALGNFGDYKPISDGVYELKLPFGGGYRIYFGLYDKNAVLLLCGGDKKSQKQDILNAIDYWRSYRGEKHEKH